MKNRGATKRMAFAALFVRNTVKVFIAIASFIAIALASPDANADRLKGTFSTGRQLDSGGCFSTSVNRGIGTGYVSANVQLSGWDFDFKSSDHHIDRVRLIISGVSYNSSTGNVSFTVSGCYDDKNNDDDYYWEVWYTILAQT